MVDEQLSELVQTTIGTVLNANGFKGPLIYSNYPTTFSLVYTKAKFGVCVDVDLRDKFIGTMIYSTTNGNRPVGYRDENDRIRQRYLFEIVETLGLASGIREAIKNNKQLHCDFGALAKAVCEEEAGLLEKHLPQLYPIVESLFGMTKIDGQPFQYYR